MFSWQVPGDEQFQCGRSHPDVEDLVIAATASAQGKAEDIREKVASSRSMKDNQGILLQFHRPSGQFRIVIPHAVDVAKRTVIGVNGDWRSSEIYSERANSGHQRQGFFFHCRIRNSEVPPDEASDSDSILDVPSHRLSEKEPL